jgi:hypothetical protein
LAFSSGASNLVENDTNNNAADIFVRDLAEGTTELVSVDSSGIQSDGSGGAEMLGISADGRYVVFASRASDLVENDTNDRVDVFVHDRQTGTTERVNVDSSENQSNGDDGVFGQSPTDVISTDGRYVVFVSSASDLVENDTNNNYDVFVRDRQEGTTKLMSVDGSGSPGGGSLSPSMSADGRYVAFFTDGNIFVRDLQAGTTELVSVTGAGGTTYSTISADGRFVAFNPTGGGLFVHDRQTGVDHQVNLLACSTEAEIFGTNGNISDDGRYVAFASSTSNDLINILLRDMHTGTTEEVSVDNSGNPANNHSFSHSVSTDGGVAFSSFASNLVENDTNNTPDVFLRRVQATQSNDEIAPTTTACGHTNDTWTNQDAKLTFSAQDNEDGSGVKDIHFSATGAQSIPETVYNTYNSPVINTEGTTTVSYFATDNVGNKESPAKTLTVKIDRTPPKIATTSPKNNATGVPVTAKISATFSESGSGIDPDSLIYDNISVVQVKPTGNVPVSGTLTYDTGSKTATFTPSTSLAKGLYRATITLVTDKAGNSMPDYSWSFATAGPSKK